MGTAAQFNMYLTYEPDNITAHYNRGFAFLTMGMTDWAVEDFEKVLEINPGHIEALAKRGVSLLKTNPDQACLDIQKAAQKGSAYAKNYLDRCQ